MSRCLFLLFLLLTMSMTIPLPSVGQNDMKLVKQVVLSRHGVRSPTQPAAELHSWSSREWPVWPVERGELTPRGAELVMAQWQQERQRLEVLHLLPPKACPSPSSLFVYADLDQRTQATAGAILLGLAPECAIPYATASTRMDPLFHPVKAGVERLDRKAAERDILATAGGSLAVLEEELSSGIETVASVIGRPGPGFCMENRSPAPCSLMTIPSHVAFSEKGDTVTLEGRLGIASSLAEIFLLEYGQWPGKPSGWGLADKTALQHMLPVHSRVFDTINRAPSVARARGGLLLEAMHAALFGQAANPAVNAADLIVFVGHDTNIATVGALLGLHWKLPDYPPDGIPPGSCLILNLWETGDTKFVTAEFAALSMDALHASRIRPDGLHRTALSLEHLSGMPDMPLRCPAMTFSARIRAALNTH